MELAESGNSLLGAGVAQPGSGEGTAPLKVKLGWSERKIIQYFSGDILAQAKLDVLEVFDWVTLEIKNTDEIDLEVANMTEMKMMIGTRPRYPSNKLTFTIANLTRGKITRYIALHFNSYVIFDVDLFLENSKRNLLNSFRFFWS